MKNVSKRIKHSLCNLGPVCTISVFIRKLYGDVPFWPTVETETFSYPASNENGLIRKYYTVYTTPFSYAKIFILFSNENGIGSKFWLHNKLHRIF